MPPKRSKIRRSIIVAVLCTLVLAGGLGLMILAAGRVTGLEFAPTHFTTRRFTFWEIPLVHLQLSPIDRTAETTPVTNYLRSKNLISVPSTAPKSWQLVEISRGINSTTLADPQILTAYLQLEDRTGTPVWETWSRDHPAAAAVLWPVVQRLAKTDLYLMMPDLFAVAQRETDATELTKKIDEYLRTAYLELAQDLADARRRDLAAAVVADGLAQFPQDAALTRLSNSLKGEGPAEQGAP